MIACPLCQKEIEPPATACPRCRADVALLADHMGDLQSHLERAERHRKAGELAAAVEAYLDVLDVDPNHAAARAALGPILHALRVPRHRPESLLVTGAVIAALAFAAGAVSVWVAISGWIRG